jgi:hypothetical protein
VPRSIRGGLAALAVIAVLAVAQSAAAAAQEPTAENPFLPGVEIERPSVDLDRVLRRRQLVVSYSCMEACQPFMRLRVAGIALSTFDPPGGPTAGSRRAVFELGLEDRRAIVSHTHGGVATFRIGAVFTNKTPARATEALRFRLRR